MTNYNYTYENIYTYNPNYKKILIILFFILFFIYLLVITQKYN